MFLVYIYRSSSLCSGDLHPDNVLRVERQCRDDKVSYYRELNKYHHEYAHCTSVPLLFVYSFASAVPLLTSEEFVLSFVSCCWQYD